MVAPAEIRFDGWTLRGEPRELFKDGVRVRLQDQPIQILDELLARPGELVTREQLIALLWPKRIVDFDSALNAGVRRLRTALGDDAETPRYIETVPRRGYRFIGSVLPPAAPDPAHVNEAATATRYSSRRHPVWAAGAVLACATIIGVIIWTRPHETAPSSVLGDTVAQDAEQSIAVLPFVDMSAGQDQEYFSDGLTEELISHLAQSLPLRVTARTSSFSFKGQPVDIATAARKLRVTHVLEGSVRRSGDRVRITAQLIDASTSSHLWSQSYDRKLDDFLRVQDEIASAVASALRVALTPRAVPPPADARLYEYLFRGRFFFQRREPGDLERAEANYRQAVELDPGFARGWAGLAGVYWIGAVSGALPRQTGLQRVYESAERALELDPNLAEAHIRMSNYLNASGNSPAATEQMRLASVLEPQNPLVIGFAAHKAAESGRLDDAVEMMRSAVEADPLAMTYRGNLASYLYFAGRFEEAKAEWLEAEKISPTQARQGLCPVLVATGEFNETLELMQDEPASAARAQCLALAYHGLGNKAQADDALGALIESHGDSDPLLVAAVYAYRGQADEAFEWLRKNDDEYRGRLGNPKIPWLVNRSPFFRSLQSDARWNTWLASGT